MTCEGAVSYQLSVLSRAVLFVGPLPKACLVGGSLVPKI